MGFRLPNEPEQIGVQRYQVLRSLDPTGSIADIRGELIDWHDTAKQPTAVV
jgi:hypothetical protein